MTDFLEDRRAAASAAYAAADKALEEARAAGGELVLSSLLEIADRHPGLRAISYEIEYVYDDEGSTYPSLSLSVAGAFEGEEEDDLNDELSVASFDRYEFARAVGAVPDKDGSITIEELRAKAAIA